MKKRLLTYGKITIMLLLSIGLIIPAFAQFSFEIPKESNARILSYDGIQVEVSGKLALCSHQERGHIILDVKGGTAPYTFLWNTNETSQNRNNLYAGTYTVEITDAKGLKYVERIVVQPPFPLILEEIETKDATCGTGNDGYAKIAVKLGRNEYEEDNVPYKIYWSNGLEDVWEADNLSPGTYTVRVADKYNCDITVSFEIKAAAEGISVSENILDATCGGNSDGNISLSVSGGVAPYTYSWSNGSTSKDLLDVKAGIYDVLIQDSKGCTFQGSYRVKQPDGITIQETISAPTCEGSENGKIELQVSGGTAPFTYTWSNGANTKSIENLGAGTYSVSISDASGCSFQKTFSIQADAPLELELVQSKGISCSGENDGEIEIAVSGTKGEAKILWSDGVEGETHRQGLAAGEYEVQVSDASGCTVSQVIQLTQSAAIQARIESVLDVNCEVGSVMGNAWVSIQGGVEPYQITWSSGEENKREITFTKTSTLIVTVEDALGCKVQAEAKVDFPSNAVSQNGRLQFNYRKLEINSEPEVLTDEEILFESVIDPEFIAWQWEFGDGNMSNDKDPIHVFESPGTYEVKLTGFDIYGCSSFETNAIEVTSITPQVVIPNAFTPNGDGLNDTFIPKMKGINSFSMDVFNTWGEKLYTTTGLESKGWDGTYKAQSLPAGNYLYKITYTDREGTQTVRTGGITLIR